MPFNWLKWHSPWIFQLPHICFFPQGALKPSCNALWLDTLKEAREYMCTLHTSVAMQTDQWGTCNSLSTFIYPWICPWSYAGQKRQMVLPLWLYVPLNRKVKQAKGLYSLSMGAGVVAQQIRAYAVFPEDLGLKSQNAQPSGNPVPGESNTLSCPEYTRHTLDAQIDVDKDI